MSDLTKQNVTTFNELVGSNSSGVPTTPVASDTNGNLLVKDYADGVDGSAVPIDTTLIGGKDPSGNLQTFITITTGEQFIRDVINVTSQYRAQSVTTTAAQALGAATILTNRKVISITPTNGTIYWGTNSSVTTTTGTPLFAFQTLVLSFTDNVSVYVISAGTVDTRIMEGS